MNTNIYMNKNLITIADLETSDIDVILQRAKNIKEKGFPQTLQQRLIGTLFFEPSTRTRLSFEASVWRSGGQVIGFTDQGSTSLSKGESLEDTIRMVSSYVDAIIMRHPEAGSAARAAAVSSAPIINGGDGAHAHPSQTLLDLFAIQECQGEIKDFTITMVGDMQYSRVAHSLARVLALYPNVKQYWVSPNELKMPDPVHAAVKNMGGSVEELSEYQSVLGETDILLMTRVQKERFDEKAEYDRLKDNYILTVKDLKSAKSSMRILSPLPRRYELPKEIDDSPHAYYFQQAADGVPVRAALLDWILND